MWKLVPSDEFNKRVQKWPKKHRRELAAVVANLKTIHNALCGGAKIEQLRFGFVHAEPSGMLALDQKGGGAGLKQCRLYVFPDKQKKELHAITIGDKDTQSDDIAFGKGFVANILSDAGEKSTDDTES